MLYAIANLELILWHKYKTRKKGKCKHSSIDQAPLIIKQKINNQWRDKIKQLMTFYSRTKKLKKLHYGD